METMNVHEKKGWIERLQALDEPTKQKVLIIATVVMMAVVIYFWLAYFNTLVAGVAGQPAAASAPQTGIWENINGGIAFFVSQFLRIAHGFADILKAPRQYLIQPPR